MTCGYIRVKRFKINKYKLDDVGISSNCPSTAPFRSPIQVSSTSIQQNVSIQVLWMSLSLKVIVISNSNWASTWHDMAWFDNLFFQFHWFQVNCNCLHGTTWRHWLITWTAILSDQLWQTLLRIANFYEILKARLQSRHLCVNCKCVWKWGNQQWAHVHLLWIKDPELSY